MHSRDSWRPLNNHPVLNACVTTSENLWSTSWKESFQIHLWPLQLLYLSVRLIEMWFHWCLFTFLWSPFHQLDENAGLTIKPHRSQSVARRHLSLKREQIPYANIFVCSTDWVWEDDSSTPCLTATRATKNTENCFLSNLASTNCVRARAGGNTPRGRWLPKLSTHLNSIHQFIFYHHISAQYKKNNNTSKPCL